MQSIFQSIIQPIILGATEGATEFLPVSSSGHLLVVRKLLGLPLVGSLASDAVLQLAAALALVVYFRKDIIRLFRLCIGMMQPGSSSENLDRISGEVGGHATQKKGKTLMWAIIFGTIPAVIFGLLLQKYLDTTFRNVKLVALALIAGSVLMYVAQKYSQRYAQKFRDFRPLSIGKGIIVGFFQSLALIPGMSRSGATLSGGLLTSMNREDAVHFSFLLSVPILLGSGLKELWSVRHVLGTVSGGSLLLGSIVSFVVGLAAIHYFIRFLKNHNLTLFIWYRIVLAVVILFVF